MSKKKPVATSWEDSFAPFVEATRERFSFLEPHGYGAPRVTIEPRACTIVYWSDERANLSIFHDLGTPPEARVVPRWLTRDDGATRSFGLKEAIAVLAPDHETTRPEPEPIDPAHERAWLDWYAAFLAAHLDQVTTPSTDLVDAIEARRPKKKWWEAYQ